MGAILQCVYMREGHFLTFEKQKEDYIMAYVITDDCVMCGTCADACPVEAISEGDGKYVIDADVCAECGTCVAECPSEAIVEA